MDPNLLDTIQIRRAERASDAEQLVGLSQELLADGTTYVFEPHATKHEIVDYWFPRGSETYLALDGGTAAGCYYLKPTQPGRGSHVANASYLVASSHRGQGLGRHLALHSIERARECGYAAMQFSMVVATNDGAIRLWRSLGFKNVGRIPLGFRHEDHGYVDVLIMHRKL